MNSPSMGQRPTFPGHPPTFHRWNQLPRASAWSQQGSTAGAGRVVKLQGWTVAAPSGGATVFAFEVRS
jgi:hypothetical protein